MTGSKNQNWQQEFARWVRPFLDALGHKARRRWAPVYLRGLIAPGERKSIQPLAARTAPTRYPHLHHFVAASTWDTAPLQSALAQEADQLVGGPDALLIVDDTTLPKQGDHSVGVAHQYSGALGKNANCQALVSLTLARGEVPVPIALRLFLPTAWTDDPERCAKVGVPEDRQLHWTKPEIAMLEIDRVLACGVRFGVVLADAGYGANLLFRQALSARGLRWAVGVSRVQKLYPLDVEVLPPQTRPQGRGVKYSVPSKPYLSAEWLMATLPKHLWQEVRWRKGTKGWLSAQFAAVRMRVADGPMIGQNDRLPGDEVWVVGEERADGERKYYLSNLPPETPLEELVRVIKARWACEQAHQQLKEELGLDHFEGRSWSGLHHHTLLAMIAFTFLQHLRVQQAQQTEVQRDQYGPPPKPTLPVIRRALSNLLVAPDQCPHCGRNLVQLE